MSVRSTHLAILALCATLAGCTQQDPGATGSAAGLIGAPVKKVLTPTAPKAPAMPNAPIAEQGGGAPGQDRMAPEAEEEEINAQPDPSARTVRPGDDRVEEDPINLRGARRGAKAPVLSQ